MGFYLLLQIQLGKLQCAVFVEQVNYGIVTFGLLFTLLTKSSDVCKEKLSENIIYIFGYLSLIIVIFLSLQKIQLIKFIYFCCFLVLWKNREENCNKHVKTWGTEVEKRKKQERLKEKYKRKIALSHTIKASITQLRSLFAFISTFIIRFPLRHFEQHYDL